MEIKRKTILLSALLASSLLAMGMEINAYAQTTAAPDVTTNIFTAGQAVLGLIIAGGSAIGVIVSLILSFQGKTDHNGNVSRLVALETAFKGFDQKIVDTASKIQQSFTDHKAEIMTLISIGFKYDAVFAQYLQKNNLSISDFITEVQNGTLDAGQVKQILSNMTNPNPTSASTVVINADGSAKVGNSIFIASEVTTVKGAASPSAYAPVITSTDPRSADAYTLWAYFHGQFGTTSGP